MSERIPISELVNAVLDSSYRRTAGLLLKQIQALSRQSSARIQQALRELEKEAERLSAENKRMSADNPALEGAQRAMVSLFTAAATLILANDEVIQNSGRTLAVASVTARVFRALADKIQDGGGNPLSPAALKVISEEVARRGIKWIIPKAVDFAGDYVATAEWAAKMEAWAPGYAKLINKGILDGIAKGWGSKQVARAMRHYAENMPVWAADNLMRTLQITSYRDAALAMEKINGQLIQGKIRIAKLDDRTCLACIALHGTPLKPGERVDDHYRGRCSEFYICAGGPKVPGSMQADSTPGNRNFVPWQTGEEWFASLPRERQERQASFRKSPGKLEAYRKSGALSGFVGDHEDPVFGAQIVESSLKGMEG